MHALTSIRLAEMRQDDLRASAACARLASDARRGRRRRRRGGVRSLVALLWSHRPTSTAQPAAVVTPAAIGRAPRPRPVRRHLREGAT